MRASKQQFRRVYRRLEALLFGRRRYALTRTGVLFGLGLFLVGAAALISANNLLFLIVAAMLSTILVSGFVSQLGLAGLELDFEFPEAAFARRSFTARLAVRNAKRWLPSFSISVRGVAREAAGLSGPEAARPILSTGVYFPFLAGGSISTERVTLEFPRRGPYRQESFLFSTRFPFGFLEKSVIVRLPRELTVYPSVDPRPELESVVRALGEEIEAMTRGSGNDFHRIRPYEPAESARNVDWRASAHTGALQVREFARDEDQAVEILLDRAARSAAWFDDAVECCASLAWDLNRRGSAVRLRTDECTVTADGEEGVYAILKYLALVHATAERPAAAWLESLQNGRQYRILFTESARGELPVVVDRVVVRGDLGTSS